MERTYDDSKLFNASKKCFAEAKNTLESGEPLRLVVSKSHEWRTAKSNLLGEGIENQALLESHDAILIRRLTSGRIAFWNRGSQKLYGWSMKEAMGKPADDLLQTELPEPLRDIKAQLRWHGCRKVSTSN